MSQSRPRSLRNCSSRYPSSWLPLVVPTEKSYVRWVKGRQDRLDSLVTGAWAAE
jgi:hypothetical protein